MQISELCLHLDPFFKIKYISSNEQYTQRAECRKNDESMNWKQSQSQHYQENSGNSEQVYQQGYDNQYDGKRDYYSQSQGRHGTYGGQQSSNWYMQVSELVRPLSKIKYSQSVKNKKK
jgi:hypothetical protein